MREMKKVMKKFSVALLVPVMIFTSCELDLQQDPNEISPDQASPDFLLNNLSIGLAGFFHETTEFGMRMARMEHQGGASYEAAYQAQSFDDQYEVAYAGLLQDANLLIPLANQAEFFTHTGIAYFVQSYALTTMVDTYGDLPFSEALDPNNLNPAIDDGASIYEAALVLLDSARANFARTPLASPAFEPFYDGDRDAWTRLCNTMELRLLVNRRLVDQGAGARVSQLVSDPASLMGPGDDFVFNYSTNAVNPDSRHPLFIDNYLAGASDYMANYFMFYLQNDKIIEDPRLPWYIYRQVSELSEDVNEISCVAENAPPHYGPNDVFCDPGNGYWGRDHLDPDGIPPDNFLRSAWGIYPVGGRWDDESFTAIDAADGLAGAGIEPIYLYNYSLFVRAEAALTLNTGEDARALLDEAVRESITFVTSFTDANTVAPDQADIDSYVGDVLGDFDNAADQLEVVAEEYYKAAFGNGVEVYNSLRRTLYPNDLQPALSPSPGEFYRSFLYPSVLVNRNRNADQKTSNAVQVFWDTNPAGAIE
jgi:hypothetical protein